MANKKLNFTKKKLTEYEYEGNKSRNYLYDTKEQGLVLDITPSNRKTFYLYKKINGKPNRIKIGLFPETTIEQARSKALELKAQISKGINPNQERKKLREDITFREMFEKYIEDYAKLHTKKWKETEKNIKSKLSHLLSHKASLVTYEKLNDYHKSHGKKHPYAANRTIEAVRAIYNKAIEWGWQGINPASRIKLFREISRDRFLLPEEREAFFKSVMEDESQDIKDYIFLSLMTGARKMNILSMKWKDISFEMKHWKLTDTKNNEVQIVPLIDEAIAILTRKRKEIKESEIYVFPSNGKTGHLVEIKRPWQRILKRANIDDFRIHDLRRTLGSYQAIAGASLQIIGKSLGHKSHAATQVYARLNTDPIRDSMQQAVKSLFDV